MNRIIKIALITIMLLSIVVIITLLIKRPPSINGATPKPLVERVDSLISVRIVNEDYVSASKGFDFILDEIATEASILNPNGSNQLTTDEVNRCRVSVFDTYLSVFDKYQRYYFNQSSWSDEELKALKSRAQTLLDMNIAKGKDKSTLDSVVINVNDYYKAWEFINHAKSCASIEAAQIIEKQVERYLRSPLTNNASLRAGLENAFYDAKSSLAKKIIAISNLQQRKKQIDRYKEAFGKDAVYDDILASYDYEIAIEYETVVVVDGINVRLRRTPEINNTNIITENLHPNNGDRLRYLGETYDFYKVRYKGYNAYISKQFSHAINKSVVVVDGVNVRLRKTPQINNTNIITENLHPENGDHLKYLGETYDFYKVRYKGYDAYLSKQFSHTIKKQR